ncbi:MAG: clostripain-related cysteine peptidase, partial [Promethearchaeota archaeon]
MVSLKYSRFSFALVFLLSLTCVTNGYIPNISPERTKQFPKAWTIMLYMDGDNDLEQFAIQDLKELELIPNNEAVNFIVQLDRSPGYDSSNGDWTNIRRFEVSYNPNVTTIGSNYINLSEKNMGDDQTLADFIDYCQSNYPAENYALILWDHGMGVKDDERQGGVCYDYSSNRDYLTFPEIESVLKTRHMNFLAFDTCSTGMIEVVHQLAGLVDIIVFSEETMPDDGAEYNSAFTGINNITTAVNLATQYVSVYGARYIPSDFPTLSAIDVNLTSNLTDVVDSLARALFAVSSSKHTEINEARINSQVFDFNQ